MKRPFFPFVLVVFFVTVFYAQNLSMIAYAEYGRALLLLLVGTAVVWALCALLIRDIEKGAASASVLFGAFFAYSTLAETATFLKAELGLAFYVVVFIAMAGVAGWKFKWTETANIASLLLAGVSLANLGWVSWRSLASTGSGSVSLNTVTRRVTNRKPNLYYIILDGFGRPDVLKQKLALDLTPVVSEFEALGFVQPQDSSANYCQTELSLASSLNLDFVQSLNPPKPGYEGDRGWLRQQVLNSRLVRDLEGSGYEFGAITTGFPPFRFPKNELTRPKGGLTFFESSLLTLTPLARRSFAVESQFVARREWLEDGFRTLERLGPTAAKPKFVFAHILAPHPPFVYRADGSALRPKGTFGYWDGSDFTMQVGTRDEYVAGYQGQAEYILKRTLQAVRRILKESKVPPIIVIQGDHGSKSRLDQLALEKTDIGEVFPNLNLILAPEAVQKQIPEDHTPVNTWRLVWNHLTGEKLPMLPNRQFWSPFPEPYAFTDVTEQVPVAASKP